MFKISTHWTIEPKLRCFNPPMYTPANGPSDRRQDSTAKVAYIHQLLAIGQLPKFNCLTLQYTFFFRCVNASLFEGLPVRLSIGWSVRGSVGFFFLQTVEIEWERHRITCMRAWARELGQEAAESSLGQRAWVRMAWARKPKPKSHG